MTTNYQQVWFLIWYLDCLSVGNSIMRLKHNHKLPFRANIRQNSDQVQNSFRGSRYVDLATKEMLSTDFMLQGQNYQRHWPMAYLKLYRHDSKILLRLCSQPAPFRIIRTPQGRNMIVEPHKMPIKHENNNITKVLPTCINHPKFSQISC